VLPVIALVGRPNVGKSTLFNRLTRSRNALVADYPGLTRDRQYGTGKLGDRPYLVIDTGGLTTASSGIDPLMVRQVQLAIEEADLLLFLVDAQDGLNSADEQIARQLRQTGKPIVLLANKVDHLDVATARADFFQLGLGEPIAIVASQGKGVTAMINRVLQGFPEAPEGAMPEDDERIRIAIVGRPNVGKSTLINRLLGEERLVAFDQPGTTRDSIEIPLEKDDRRFVLIDTAGVRRRSRVSEAIEKYSIIKTLDAIEHAHLVFMLLDAQQGAAEQDATLIGHILESGRALLLVINKWDGLSGDVRDRFKNELERRFPYLQFAPRHFVSALHGSGVGLLLQAAEKVYASAMVDLNTHTLTEILEEAVQEHQPPLVKGRRIKLRYAHQGGRNPPIIVVHGNQTEAVPDAYRRYLSNRFRERLQLTGTPLRLEFKTADNPFKGRRNTLSERQIRKRRRLKQFVNRK
jgi:GTP-binding protein